MAFGGAKDEKVSSASGDKALNVDSEFSVVCQCKQTSLVGYGHYQGAHGPATRNLMGVAGSFRRLTFGFEVEIAGRAPAVVFAGDKCLLGRVPAMTSRVSFSVAMEGLEDGSVQAETLKSSVIAGKRHRWSM
ncbi:MAG: hypothetical protein ABI169_13585 [Chitinophagaceae bacterium]